MHSPAEDGEIAGMSAAPGKIFVLQAMPGQTSLGRIGHPRVRLSTPEDGYRPHQIALFPASLEFAFTDGFEAIPDWAWQPAREGRGKVVFDASLEGHPHKPERTQALHAVLQRAGVPKQNAVYLTQDRGYADAYRRHCEELGEGPPMKVLVYDYWVRRVMRLHEKDGAATFQARLQAYEARPRRRARRFLSLNQTLRYAKVLFLLRLMRDGLWSEGAISVGGLAHRQSKGMSDLELDRQLFGHPRFEDLSRELRPLMPQLAALGRVMFSAGGPGGAGSIMDEPLAEYADTWFSVITETEMRERPQRITEKPLKALLNFHPLIVLGNFGSLGLLREYGFESYPGMFDEAYDQEPDPRQRFEMVYREVERLCALDEAELDRLDRASREAVVRNAQHGLMVLPRRFREEIDPKLVHDILEPVWQA